MIRPWPMIPLGKVLTLQRRWLKVDALTDYTEIGIRSYGRGIFHKSPVSGASLGNKRVLRIEPGDLVLMNVFAWEGAVAVAGANEAGKIGSHRFATYTPIENVVDSHFLRLFFRTPVGRDLLGHVSPGSAGRNRTMNLAAFAQQPIPLPPIDEQRRIVARIDELADNIAKAKALCTHSFAAADALHDSELRRILLRLTDSDCPQVPLPNVSEINPGKSSLRRLEADATVSFVPMSAVDDVTGTIARPQSRPYTEVAKGYTAFMEGDVIFARITPCMQNGKSAIARNLANSVGFGSTEFHVIRPSNELTAEWLHLMVRHKDFLDDAKNHFKGTAGQQRVPESFLQQKTIPVPPSAEQRRIAAYLDRLSAKGGAIKQLQQSAAAELNALLPSILDRAFSGKL